MLASCVLIHRQQQLRFPSTPLGRSGSPLPHSSSESRSDVYDEKPGLLVQQQIQRGGSRYGYPHRSIRSYRRIGAFLVFLFSLTALSVILLFISLSERHSKGCMVDKS